jgi:FkbH-like protein
MPEDGRVSGERMDDLNKAMDRLRKEQVYSAYTSVSNILEDQADGEATDYRVAILRNITVEPVLPVIAGEIGLLGLQPKFYVGDFDTIAQDIFSPKSDLFSHNADAIILFQWLELLSPALQNEILSLGAKGIEQEIERVLDHFRTQFSALRDQTTAGVLVNNFPILHRPTLGIIEAQSGGVQNAAMVKLNTGLAEVANEFSDVYIVDLQGLFARLGAASAFDERYWAMAKAPIGKNALVPVGQEYGRFFRALSGHARKCLVLDCDGTLWGGVVGEDGLSGIRLGLEYPGNSFVAFQREVLNLYNRGVILAVCSKNNEDDVLEVFRDHPDRVLKENHFAALRVNWSDKAENLISIADELNIGVDALVFVDDTDFECDRVRGALPEVGVLHLSGDPSSFRRQLSEAGLFDNLTVSDDDLKRNKSYQAERQRKSLSKTASSLEDYLGSLDIKAKIGLVTEKQIPRASQLTQKTNQFNLTTKRYTEGEIRAFSDRDGSDVLTMWLGDNVAEIGTIGVAIILYKDETAEIDSFLLSCRALGREAENAFLKFVIDNARTRGCKTISGSYLPTKKNAQVSEFYEKRGFDQVEDTEWCLDLSNTKADKIICPAWINMEEFPK